MPFDRREVNDFRQNFFGAEGRVIALICDCAELKCTQTVKLTSAELDAIRAAGGWVLAPGHAPLEDAPLAAEAAEVPAEPLLDATRIEQQKL